MEKSIQIMIMRMGDYAEGSHLLVLDKFSILEPFNFWYRPSIWTKIRLSKPR